MSTSKQLWWDAKKELYRRDFALYAAEQLTITGTRPGEMFKMREFTDSQKILHSVIEDQIGIHGWIRVVLIKYRQLGASTYTTGRAFSLASLNRAVSSLLVAQDEDTSRAVFEKCKTFYYNLSEEIQPLLRLDNKKELKFENPDAKTRSKFPGLNSNMRFAHAKNILSGTGTTQHFLHLTEAAKYRSEVCSLLESSFFPALHLVPGTACINESTAFVGGDYFRGCCERAMSGRSEWRFVFIPWYMDRRYRLPLDVKGKKSEKILLDAEERFIQKLAKKGQQYGDYIVPPVDVQPEQFKWRRAIIAGREDGGNIFKQEYPSTYEEAWITLDLNVFRKDKLHEMRQFLKNPSRFGEILPDGRIIENQHGRMGAEESYFAIWEEPTHGAKYDIGLDTSAGLEDGDFCVAEVWNRNTHEQAAEFRVRLDAFDLGEKIYWLGHFYNTAQISLEMANTGFAVNAQLQRLGYPYLYIWRHRERAFPTLSTYTGWKTTRESKSYMISLFSALVNKLELKIHSHVLWNEMNDYVRIPGMAEGFDQYRGNAGYDDCVMAAGIGLVALDDETFGLHSPKVSSTLSRKEQIEAAIKHGGVAFHDEGRIIKPNAQQSMKNWSRGFD